MIRAAREYRSGRVIPSVMKVLQIFNINVVLGG